MTATDAMRALDQLVEDALPVDRYTVARSLYAAAVAGLLSVQIPPRMLYLWVVKWAAL